MRWFSKSIALLAAVIGLVCVSVTSCSTPSTRPDPTMVVKTYLDAVAGGDAITAAAMDPTFLATTDDGDADVLRTNAALHGAVERISGVEVDADARNNKPNDDARRVTFSYDLGNKRVSSSLAVEWDSAAGGWRLTESIAGRIFVRASTSPINADVIGYSVPGATVTISRPPHLFQWAYPAVYEVTPDIDAGLLTDPRVTRRAVTVSPGADETVDVSVTRLPTHTS